MLNLDSSASMFPYRQAATSLQPGRKTKTKQGGWRDGGAVSVKEEEKIKWQGGYEMCV